MKTLALMLVVLFLTACATQEKGRVTGKTTNTPLHDFNIAGTEIPPVLLEARKQPYALPADLSCPALASAIRDLTEVLGPDIDVILAESGAGDVVGEAAMGAFQGMLDGLLPFRSWIRRLSGADQHARNLAASIAAGNVRRAFLKGVSLNQSCPVLAAQ